MDRAPKATFHVDECKDCGGTWFDVGELGTVFGRVPQQGLAASTIDENAPDPVPRALLEIAFFLLRRLVLPL
jgi:Zn-finger nucleic acid-binding protein